MISLYWSSFQSLTLFTLNFTKQVKCKSVRSSRLKQAAARKIASIAPNPPDTKRQQMKLFRYPAYPAAEGDHAYLVYI